MSRVRGLRGAIQRLLVFALLILAAPQQPIAQTAMPQWPHTIKADGGTAVIYQPQAVTWPDHGTLTARAAVAVTSAGTNNPVLGSIELTLATHTDAATGMVILSDPQLKSSHFPALDTERAARLEEHIRKALPTIRISAVPLNSVLLSLKEQEQPQTAAIKNDPPTIFYSDKPASLVAFDGDPVMAPVGKAGLTYAVNTNWEVFHDGATWYLLNDGLWLAAPAFTGPYKPVSKLPAAFLAIPNDANFAAAHNAIPPHAMSGGAPVILVSTTPAAIIVTHGAPQFVPIAGTGLQAVKNTNSALFFEPSSGQFYLLISGRWFSAGGLNGPWSFASDHLPADFSMIPADGPYGSVLTSVPETSQAQLAVLQAQVPKQATLKKDAAKLNVVYAGPPRFNPIPGTQMLYAINTPYQVIETGARYYACYQGAWFESASPFGPWVLAASIPQVIYAIPPSSPLYPVTFVKVYGATPTTVTYGFTAGYTMGFIAAGTIVYGTGYYYPPVVLPGPVPIYYPYPYSYAGNVWYNSTTGAWTRGGAVYGPYGVAQGGTYYNPSTGAFGRGGSVYGPNGGAGAFSYYNPSTGGYARGSSSWNANGGFAQASYYNPRTGVAGSTNQNWNPYSRWGSSTFAGPNQTVNAQSGSNARGSAGSFQSSTGAEGAGYRGAGGNQGGAVRTQTGDVYAGHDGNVYQHTDNGWSKWNNGGWQPVNPPASASQTQRNINNGHSRTTQTGSAGGSASARSGGRQSLDATSYQQLERDRQARLSGTQRYGSSSRFGGEGFGSGGSGFGGGGRFRR